MDRPILLQAIALLPEVDRALLERYTVHRLAPAGAERDAQLAQVGPAIDGLVTSARAGFDEALLARLPNLRVISSFGVGLDVLDVPAARRRGIPVGYTPDVLTDCVADLAFGLLLSIARRIPEGDRYVRAGRWVQQPPQAFPLARKVSGARLGIVGLGRIGQAIAQRASGFAMDVRYTGRRPVQGATLPFVPQLQELARWSDFLVVSTPGGADTRHLIDAGVLDALGPEGFLVNIARGSVVDEKALVAALERRSIAGAALDVFEHEPSVPQELLSLDNVVLLPHVASATHETRAGMGQRVLDNLAAFFDGQPLPSPA
ncbi:2-hydroxyacid dehydrogenase [Ramlibacter sp. Leaf400]|uniref:2-hydroxyacid dehydrogenase n=1 Tax=Ramlibacter sp. Leaf400 TaxID=1736365 RepID=UPI0006FCA5B9|nr:2-hydroxyacid dehydrogenase [Ramlibacter sp. Leaf400]KQT13377.1 hydroxyacid dehydrogenase [Ramlibacter sp. Leaf400]